MTPKGTPMTAATSSESRTAFDGMVSSLGQAIRVYPLNGSGNHRIAPVVCELASTKASGDIEWFVLVAGNALQVACVAGLGSAKEDLEKKDAPTGLPMNQHPLGDIPMQGRCVCTPHLWMLPLHNRSVKCNRIPCWQQLFQTVQSGPASDRRHIPSSSSLLSSLKAVLSQHYQIYHSILWLQA